ncbi:aspartate/glutamate racemase family protein [Chelatococcus sp. SYSU_G07232]|uniref:Aspartate/glutamate racemase family protein n=1 Tax=Chelatococcus albus TaxID=3047466 RepID=A0ABT7AIJ5_9HYPH|nr:aspartate/glutamate racemase family protein [Chelatococcus sp. SYSU_G07232]MDJ1159201.1 aspartate/glutamate racemase family protein [Chelatococcus sp. SYSU_G07232]
MTRRIRLGMLTPSSHTVLEPVTAAMLAGLPEVTAHFSRFKVTEIALTSAALGQFDDSEILRAAELLAHARVDVVAWNGTSASWLGFERDERLCERITAATGIPACTSVLAFREIFTRTGVRRFGLVTPYLPDVQERIVANWGASGFACAAERHLALQDNFSFAELDEEGIAGLIRAVARERCDAVAVVCTNMRGAPVAEALERELGIPVYDSIATTLWKALLVAGADPARVRGWGGLFGLGSGTPPDRGRAGPAEMCLAGDGAARPRE